MGYDIYGTNPTSPEGDYFRRSIWSWSPIPSFCIDTAPELCEPCDYWFSNDGTGLDSDQAIALADHIDTCLADGTADAYIADRIKEDEDIPTQVKCERHTLIDIKDCNSCKGTGLRDNWLKGRGILDRKDLVEWSTFIRASGGFEIW